MRKLYPNSEVRIQRSPFGLHYDVSLRIDQRDLVGCDKAETLRDLDRKLFPRQTKPRKHWSLFRSGRR